MTFTVLHHHRQNGADAFTPTQISGLQLWIDFSDATKLFTDAGSTPVASDGDLIYQANDKSGSGNNLIQATEGLRLIYKTNRQNSKSAAWSDAVDSIMTSGAMTLNQPFTLFMAAKSLTAATGKYMFQVRTGVNGFYLTTNSTILGCVFGSYLQMSVGPGNATPFIAYAIANGASSKVSYNAAAALAGAAGANAGNAYTIGGASNASAVADYYECLAYSGALSDPDIARVVAYLNAKWAVY